MYKLKRCQQVYCMQAFRNGRFALLEIPSGENNFLCKINLKFAYFSVPLCMSPRKFVRFALSGNLSQEILKTIKGTNSSTDMRLNIHVAIYLNNILLMGRTLE